MENSAEQKKVVPGSGVGSWTKLGGESRDLIMLLPLFLKKSRKLKFLKMGELTGI